jgi:Matrixin
MRAPRLLYSTLFVLLASLFAVAGGPLVVGGPAVGTRPAYGKDGQPFTWNPAAMPIQYRVDPGPMAVTSGKTVISHADGVTRLQGMFAVWQNVPTAAVSFANAGPLLSAGTYTGGDVSNMGQLNALIGSCQAAAQNPVIFDADGTLISALGLPPEIIGYASGCALDESTGYLTGAAIILNGKMQDGVSVNSTPPNYELSANQFDEVIVHEMGHFLGLDHSQTNLDILTNNQYPCDVDELAGSALMFPELLCQARKDAGLPVLAPDDVAWISTLYPGPTYASSYGTISGRILFADGISQVQGANVIARLVDDPNTPEDESRRVVVSAISGYLFTANPGQSFTASMSDPTEDNTNGWKAGSRNPQLIGYYQIPVPPGTYTVEVESVYSGFISESGIGPFSPPIPIPGAAEFWNNDESAFDFPAQRDTVTVHAGDKITDIDIILNGSSLTYPRFDQYEFSGALFDPPPVAPLLQIAEVAA